MREDGTAVPLLGRAPIASARDRRVATSREPGLLHTDDAFLEPVPMPLITSGADFDDDDARCAARDSRSGAR